MEMVELCSVVNVRPSYPGQLINGISFNFKATKVKIAQWVPREIRKTFVQLSPASENVFAFGISLKETENLH